MKEARFPRSKREGGGKIWASYGGREVNSPTLLHSKFGHIPPAGNGGLEIGREIQRTSRIHDLSRRMRLFFSPPRFV